MFFQKTPERGEATVSHSGDDTKINTASICDIIQNNILPQALMIGVSYNDFWELNPNTLEPFIKAYSLKEKSFDRLMWQMGIYIRTAIGSCLDSKNIKYPNKPFSQIDVMEDMKARFMRDAERINQTLRNKKEVK